MKLICITGAPNLTLNKVYQAINSRIHTGSDGMLYYQIEDDISLNIGMSLYYSIDHFKPLAEYRQEQLDKILC